jgi:RNA binding exosome subunit
MRLEAVRWFNVPVIRFSARVYIHATEDPEKVMKALLNIFPEDLRGELKISREGYEGHYGNPIIVVEATISDPSKAEKALRYIVSRLSEADRRYLAASLDDRVDKSGTLYIRLSKQQAYLGELRVFESDDVIRITVAFQGSRSKAIKEYHRILMGG